MPIELRNICKSFDDRSVLVNLTHTFPDGITCVVGPSGCGKTTLLNLLAGLLQPDSGELCGVPDRIAMVFQEDRLIAHLSPLTNVRIALHGCPQERILRALDAVGLSEASRQPVRELSGGMRRRTAIVRALLSDAPLLLMDEPFKGLDAATRDRVLQFARPLLAGKTAIIVTHDPEEAAQLNAHILSLNKKG